MHHDPGFVLADRDEPHDAPFRELLLDEQQGRCFYRGNRFGSAMPVVDHFIPWSRYPMDLGENLVLADDRCNCWKSDMLPAMDHVIRWRERNAQGRMGKSFAAAGLPHDGAVVERVAVWAYSLAEKSRAQLWLRGRDELVPIDPSWRGI